MKIDLMLSVQRWSDYRLTWNISEFDGLRWIYLLPTKMWTPDIELVNKYVAVISSYRCSCGRHIRESLNIT